MPPSHSRPKVNELSLLGKPTVVKNPARIPAAIRTCRNLREVGQLHAQFVISGFIIDGHRTAGKLIESYVSMSHISNALSVFHSIHSPDAFAYNTIIRGLTQANFPYDSLLLYQQMLLRGLIPDNYTYTFVLKACSHLNSLFEGQQVHSRIIKAGISPDTHLHSSLIHMYATNSNSDCLGCAQRILSDFSVQNTVIINSMISGYLRHGHVKIAREMFDGMVAKDAASWSTMVSGYTKNGMYVEAFVVFREMMMSHIPPNESTLVSALSACAQLGALDQGRWIHAFVDRKIGTGITTLTLATSLVDMYAKCGSINCGFQVFEKMPQRDVVTWGVIISGFAMHGQASKCFRLFDEMLATGIRPNAVIFVAILSACSHAGYVEAGRLYFNQMVQDFGIRPSIEHYGCMVDILGRAGHLAEAEELIVSMPEEPNSIIWGALLGACRTHNDPRRGERAFRRLIELEPMSGDRYKLASHIFTAAGEKEDAIKMRRLIKEKELETTCGSSFIVVDGVVHEFMVGDTGHSEARDIYMMLEEIKRRLKMAGFVARRDQVLLDIEEEEKEEALSRHSERLAIAYGLLSTKAKTLIRVIKNLRVCRDCHSAIKLISKEFDREIIVRDKNRFHVFKGGECSCMDYW
ncbi:hypothetical protein HHK36_005899 [Tetracentron sinense]|uniref:DYW domain-containing protein n=1 Tax=Tetracentron sinense TaxID=13715 RepID=A0A834ZLY7_TETSI|nr:hypothetical protein HHK36_005899 [Tetracentron sinense]